MTTLVKDAFEYTLKDRGLVFGKAATGNMLPALTPEAAANPDVAAWVPKTDPNYIPGLWLGELMAGLKHGLPLYIFGPSGTGKTAGVKYLASKLPLPVYEITGHSRLEFPELCGTFHLRDGHTVWTDGPLTRAMRHGGLFLLNEQSLLDPATAAGLNTVLDGSPLYIPELNEVVQPHPNFLYIATDNTNGGGDETGLYSGTLIQNQALMSRFVLIKADYLPRQFEARILEQKLPAIAEEVRDRMLSFAEEVRSSFGSADGLSITMSPRDLLRWGLLITEYTPLAQALSRLSPPQTVMAYALDRAFAFRANAADRAALHNILQRLTGEGANIN